MHAGQMSPNTFDVSGKGQNTISKGGRAKYVNEKHAKLKAIYFDP